MPQPPLNLVTNFVATDAEMLRPHKRSYKKSLSGCKSCKARKIKCDEQRPLCANCKRRFVDITCCEYVTKKSKNLKSARKSVPSSPSKPGMQRPISFKPFEAGDSNRVMELRLLHHYTKSTCGSQCLNEMVPILCHPMWEIDIPQIAFSSPIVLDALLGISALNLLALQPGDQTLTLASRFYFNRALAKQRDGLSHLDAENAEPLLVAAVLIAHQTWLTTHFTERLDERYNLNLQTYQMCLGVTALIRRASPWLEKYTRQPENTQSYVNNETQSKGFMKHALTDLASLSVHFYENGAPMEDSAAYEKTAEELVAIYSLLMVKPLDVSRIEQNIVTILHRVTPRFLDLLEREDPMAMALLARDLSLLAFLDDSKSWWIHGAGEQKVSNKAVFGIRGLMPTEWLWAMIWPMDIIARDITLDID